MNTHDNPPWYSAIDEKLAAVVEDAEETPPWYDAWQLLEPDSDEEHRLRVYQAVRDDGCLPEKAGFYLVAWQADAITGERAETELHELQDQLDGLLEAHGLDAFDPELTEKAPAEYHRLLEEFERACDRLYVELLEEHGEEEIKRLFSTNRTEFNRLMEAGRRYFHGAP